jgi:IS1 family transposase
MPSFTMLWLGGIIFWGNSSHSGNIFRLQKRFIRSTMGAGTRDLCRELFKSLKSLPLMSQYICTWALYAVSNKSVFMEYSQLHNIKYDGYPGLSGG